MLMTTKKILITGGLGYIGSKFLQRFNAEYNFKIVDFEPSKAHDI